MEALGGQCQGTALIYVPNLLANEVDIEGALYPEEVDEPSFSYILNRLR
jgi:hypothetical protein